MIGVRASSPNIYIPSLDGQCMRDKNSFKHTVMSELDMVFKIWI
jgi:hypothetical protein